MENYFDNRFHVEKQNKKGEEVPYVQLNKKC